MSRNLRKNQEKWIDYVTKALLIITLGLYGKTFLLDRPKNRTISEQSWIPSELCSEIPVNYKVGRDDSLRSLALETGHFWDWVIEREHWLDDLNPDLGYRVPAWLDYGEYIKLPRTEKLLAKIQPDAPSSRALDYLEEHDQETYNTLEPRAEAVIRKYDPIVRPRWVTLKDWCIAQMYNFGSDNVMTKNDVMRSLAYYEVRFHHNENILFLLNLAETNRSYINNLLRASEVEAQIPDDWQDYIVFSTESLDVGGGEAFRGGGLMFLYGSWDDLPLDPHKDAVFRNLFNRASLHEALHTIQLEETHLTPEQELFSHTAMGFTTLPAQEKSPFNDYSSLISETVDPRLQYMYRTLITNGADPIDLYRQFVRASITFDEAATISKEYDSVRGPYKPSFNELFSSQYIDINFLGSLPFQDWANVPLVDYAVYVLSDTYYDDFWFLYSIANDLAQEGLEISSPYIDK